MQSWNVCQGQNNHSNSKWFPCQGVCSSPLSLTAHISEGGCPSTCMEREQFFGRKMIHHPWITQMGMQAWRAYRAMESRRRETVRGCQEFRAVAETPSAVGKTVLQNSMRHSWLYRFFAITMGCWCQCSTSCNRRTGRLQIPCSSHDL